MILVAFVFGTLGHLAGTVVGFFAPIVLDEYAGHPFVLLLVGPACAIIGCVRGATWLGRRAWREQDARAPASDAKFP